MNRTTQFDAFYFSNAETQMGHLLEINSYSIIFGNKNFNFDQLLDYANTNQLHTSFMNQQHTDIVLSTPLSGSIVCDGLQTASSSEALVVRTADCLPLVAISNTDIAILHCGRKGLLGGILSQLYSKSLQTPYHSFYIGPHIHAQSYEIGSSLFQEIQQSYPQSQALQILNKKYCLCLSTFTREQVQAHFPLAQIFELKIDTFTDQNYNSYRRDQQTRERNLSLVWKKG